MSNKTKSPDQNIFDTIFAALGKKLHASLFDEVTHSTNLNPRLTISRLGALGLATLVHGISLLFLVAGIILIAFPPQVVFLCRGTLALIFLLVAYETRPRFASFDEAFYVTRDQCPSLYRIADTIAADLGAKPVKNIYIDWNYNASYAHVGWRQERAVCLGLPLVTVLDSQELTALLAHEIAHEVNHDPSRGFYIGTAMTTLVIWYRLLRPRSMGIFFVVGAWFIRLFGEGFAQFLWRDRQRSEYLADYLAAQVCGTRALLGMLRKVSLKRVFENTFHKSGASASWNNTEMDFFGELHRQIDEHLATHPETDVFNLDDDDLDLASTHPPMAYRTRFLQSRSVASARVVPSFAERERISDELSDIQKKIQTRLYELYRASLTA